MNNLAQLSPVVRQVLADNHLKPLSVLRYGPRFVCIKVAMGKDIGMFKMMLPQDERATAAPADFFWTEHEEPARLEHRLVKEARFLQYFAGQLKPEGLEPQVLAVSDQAPVWSIRRFVDGPSMAVDDSNFVFTSSFYHQVSPRQMVDFFRSLHQASANLPQPLTHLIDGEVSELCNPVRLGHIIERMEQMPPFAHLTEHLRDRLAQAAPAYSDYQPVIAQYEPYPCHLFMVNGRISLIDWENVSWAHPLQDLSIVWMRSFDNPAWQAEYSKIIKEYGYFKGHGQLYWDSELILQALANYRHFSINGPIGTADYDRRALAFFTQTINQTMAHSPYFGLPK